MYVERSKRTAFGDQGSAQLKEVKEVVVWDMNFIFPYLGNFTIPTDELIDFRGVGIPPIRYSSGMSSGHV